MLFCPVHWWSACATTKTEVLLIMSILTNLCSVEFEICVQHIQKYIRKKLFFFFQHYWHSCCKIREGSFVGRKLENAAELLLTKSAAKISPCGGFFFLFFCYSASRFSRHFGSALDNSQLNDSQPCFLTFLRIIMALAAVSYRSGTELPNGEGRSGKQFTGKKRDRGQLELNSSVTGLRTRLHKDGFLWQRAHI